MGIQLKFNIKFEKLLQSIDGMTPKMIILLWTMGCTNISWLAARYRVKFQNHPLYLPKNLYYFL